MPGHRPRDQKGWTLPFAALALFLFPLVSGCNGTTPKEPPERVSFDIHFCRYSRLSASGEHDYTLVGCPQPLGHVNGTRRLDAQVPHNFTGITLNVSNLHADSLGQLVVIWNGSQRFELDIVIGQPMPSLVERQVGSSWEWHLAACGAGELQVSYREQVPTTFSVAVSSHVAPSNFTFASASCNHYWGS